jgi:L-lactate dehydrogenase complex protein LldF
MLTPEGSFDQRARGALATPALARAVRGTVDRLRDFRALAEIDPELNRARRAAATEARTRAVEKLPELLERFTRRCEARGGVVHRAADAAEATNIALSVLRQHGAQTVVKSKSMVTEEIELNAALEHAGLEVTETDLGEWIIQLAHEKPSHIILPAIHKTRHDVRALFEAESGKALDASTKTLCAYARKRLRERFLAADAGISGANFAVAETGSIALFTNEGNGRLVTTLPRLHIAFLGMERLVENFADLASMAEVLPRAATGQDLTSYFSIITGPRRPGECDGPEALHVIILDNGRSRLLDDAEFKPVLRCIRCAACLNVCPVYAQIGGHAYGGTYPGPIGAVLTPLLRPGDASARELANASSLCAACSEACPVGIPLHELLIHQRARNAALQPKRGLRMALRMGLNGVRGDKAQGTARRLRFASRLFRKGTPQRVLLTRLVPLLARAETVRALPDVPPQSFRELWAALARTEERPHD